MTETTPTSDPTPDDDAGAVAGARRAASAAGAAAAASTSDLAAKDTGADLMAVLSSRGYRGLLVVSDPVANRRVFAPCEAP